MLGIIRAEACVAEAWSRNPCREDWVISSSPMIVEQHYRSAGAVVGLLLAYFILDSMEQQGGIVVSAVVWSMGCVLGGMLGQRLFRWKHK